MHLVLVTICIAEGYILPEISILFERLDKKIIDAEYSKLDNQNKGE